MSKLCAVCKQIIENELDEIELNGHIVHRGVCQKFAAEKPLTESGETELTDTELLI